MQVRHRKPNETAQQLMPLLALGVALIVSNRYFSFVDNEVRSLDFASLPARTLFSRFFYGGGQLETSPLYGVILHFWLRLTAGNFEYLRIPAILIYLAGLFLLGRAAREFEGQAGASTIVWLGVLWPFGFHYGRLDEPDGFAFFLVAGLTLAYLRFVEEQDFGRSAALFLFGALLLWTTFFGWAVLLFLVIDQLLRRRAQEPTIPVRVMARTIVLWVAAYIPVARPMRREFIAGANFHHGIAALASNFALHVYNLFVSESVGPWHWQQSVPAGLAVLVCIVLVFVNESGLSRRFLIYGAVLLIFMALSGTLLSRHTFIVAPWVLLPVAIGIGSIKSRLARPVLAVSLFTIGMIGWSGMYSRTYYSEPQFLDPWVQIAGNAADKIHTGAGLVSNSRPLLFYLTYALRVPTGAGPTKFEGLIPDSAQWPNVAIPDQWLSSGHPILPAMIWIRGTSDPQTEGPTAKLMNDAGDTLDRSCGSRESRLTMPDRGYLWKQKYLRETPEEIWRIEIRQYDCASPNSIEIYPIPRP